MGEGLEGPHGGEFLRDVEGDFHGLFVVESGVELRLVGFTEISFGETARATDTFGDIFAGQFEVDTAESRLALAMDGEGAAEFEQNIFEATSLSSVLGRERIAMHWVANPQDAVSFGLNGLDEFGEGGFDAIATHAMDEGEFARFVVGV